MPMDDSPLADKLQRLSPKERAQVKEEFVARLQGEMDELLGLLWDRDEPLESTKRIDPASAEYHAVEMLQAARYSSAADLFVRHLDARSTAFPTVSDEAQVHFQF